MSREFILSVIDKYKSNPCLWQISNLDYHNKQKRNEALLEMLPLFKRNDPKANLDTVKKRIASLRNCFLKERKKVNSTSKSGAGTDEVHVPKLWYYSEMLFLCDTTEPRATTSIQSILDDTAAVSEANKDVHEPEVFELDDHEPMQKDLGETEARSPPQEVTFESPILPTHHRPKKARVHADELLSKISSQLDRPHEKKRFQAYGEHIAEKLRSMQSPIMVTYCEKLINDALFLAETNNLDISSHIMTHKITASNRVQRTEHTIEHPTPEAEQSTPESQSILNQKYDTQDTEVVYEQYIDFEVERI